MAKDLLIDDEWDPSKLGITDVARTADEAQAMLSRGGWGVVYMDNDLGPGQKEGCDLLNWIMWHLDESKWPEGFVVFTANNQARPRMESKFRAMDFAPSGKDRLGHVVWRKTDADATRVVEAHLRGYRHEQ